MGKTGFLHELRRRHVVRVAIAYAVVGWALIEVSATIIPALHLPDTLTTVIVVLVLLGSPVAVLLAWVFEMTAEGVRRTEPQASPQARVPEQQRIVGRKLDFIIIGVLVVAVAALLLPQFVVPSMVAPSAAASIDKSIAVLPFENLSADKDNAYFADGIQDEILTSLAKIGELKVISRTSTRTYGSRPENVSQIAQELGVANILEGSVQRAGDRVRINVQLIRADSDDHLWAETYDRTLNDVFAVQSEVAQKIAASLRATLTGAEQQALATRPTANTEAYVEWLKARALGESSSFDRVTIERVRAIYRRVVKLDPDFAQAWAELVKLDVFRYWEGYDDDGSGLIAARRSLDRANALAPGLPQVAIARGWYLYYGERKFEQALSAFRSAQRNMPNNDQAWFGAALVERRMGQWQASIADMVRASELNPRSVEVLTALAETRIATRDCQHARRSIDVGLALKPDNPYLQDMQAACLWNTESDLDKVARQLAAQPVSVTNLGTRANTALYQRHYDQASGLFRRAIAALGDDRSPNNYKDYISNRAMFSLALALSEQRTDRREASKLAYQSVKDAAEDALAASGKNINLRAANNAVLGMAAAGLGHAALARQHGQRAADLIPASEDAIDGLAWQRYLARIYALSGDADRALPLIAHLLTVDTTDPLTIALLRLDPVWDLIRKDLRFQALLKKYADPSSTTTSNGTGHD